MRGAHSQPRHTKSSAPGPLVTGLVLLLMLMGCGLVLVGVVKLETASTPLPPGRPAAWQALAEPPARLEDESQRTSLTSSTVVSLETDELPLLPSKHEATEWLNPEESNASIATRALPSHSPPSPVTSALFRLPHAQQEIAADGLPVNAMRCTVDGGVMNCGACKIDSDCPANKGCVANRETRLYECLASECERDSDCSAQSVCRPVTPGITGPVIRRCLAPGDRRVGEPCDAVFVSRQGACERGLVCHRGLCGESCQPGGADGCGEGYTCEQDVSGAACFPDCRARGCEQGQTCKRLDDTDHQCLDSVRGECPESPCAEGEHCNLRMSRGQGVFWCALRCDPFQADSCPAEQVCGVGGATISTCFKRCDPMLADACAPGWMCASVTEDRSQFGCTPVPVPAGAAGVRFSPTP